MRVVDLHAAGYAWTFGLLADALAELGLRPRHVLHVGAHLGQEVPHYRAAGIKRIRLVEPTPANAAHLRATFPDVTVHEVACGPEPGQATLSLCGGDGAWNTLRPGGDDSVTVNVVAVRDLQMDADMLVVDTQGTELDALASADLDADALRLVVVETNVARNPDAALLADATAFMREHGWQPGLMWSHDRPRDKAVGFRDVFYVRVPA